MGTLASTTYDTVFSATYSDGSSASMGYSFTIPQFPVSASTLYAVSVNSKVTLGAQVTVFNTNSATTSPTVELFRSDGFTSSATNDNNTAIPATVTGAPLAPFTSEVINIPHVLTNYPILSDSITNSNSNFGNFTGDTTYTFNYATNNIPLPSAGTFATSTVITESINFHVTYYYCNTGTLATSLLTFTATLGNDRDVLLNWTTTDEQTGRKYGIEVSTDGANFTDNATVPAQNGGMNDAYSYNFPIAPGSKGILYFRLRLENVAGPDGYSPVAAVNLGDGRITAFSIYPNPPSTFINLTFPGNSQDWQVQIFAADGDMVQQNYFSNTNLATVNFNRKMAAGAYFVRAINPQTNDHYAGSFVIRD
jgi:hypothetical protein